MTYPGGKNGSGVYHSLINLMPPHRVYIEPFLGSGAVMRYKRPAALNIGIDLKLLPSFRMAMLPAHVLGGNGEAISKQAARSYLAENADRRRRAAIRPAAPKMAMRTATAKMAMADPTDVSIGGNSDARGPRYEFIEGDGIGFLEAHGFQGDELVYCDPPYLMSSRDTPRQRYEYEMGSDVDHRRLLRCLRTLRCYVMISGYSSVLYARELKDWNAVSFPGKSHGGPRAEWVWCNFPRPVALHDYGYLGSDFRERECIKRQITRWKNRLSKMPIVRRQALLSAIADLGESGDAAARRI